MRKNISDYRMQEPAHLNLRAGLLLNKRLRNTGLDLQFDNLGGLCRYITPDDQVYNCISLERMMFLEDAPAI